MGQRTSPELRELQERWAVAVLLGDVDAGPLEVDPEGGLEWMLATRRPMSCWFGENVPGIDSCEGRIEGAHWLKRQRVEHVVAAALGIPEPIVRGRRVSVNYEYPPHYANVDLVHRAAWDPRNGVPACNKHHTRFDSQRMPILVVWRHEVPPDVEAFARDWGLEGELERRNPDAGVGI